MDGYELARPLRARPATKRARLIAVTGVKPVDLSELIGILAKAAAH